MSCLRCHSDDVSAARGLMASGLQSVQLQSGLFTIMPLGSLPEGASAAMWTNTLSQHLLQMRWAL